MARRRDHFHQHLELYAFWTGFASTIISLAEVIVLAVR